MSRRLSRPAFAFPSTLKSRSVPLYPTPDHFLQRTTCNRKYSNFPRHTNTQTLLPLSNPQPLSLAFSTSTQLHKRGGKQESKRNVEVATAKTVDIDDPYDFSELEAGIQRAIEKLKDDLSKLRPGGRFNPDIVEALRVQLTKGSKETVRLGDLAQVVPRGGRTVVIMVGETDHLKPISSAILSSPHSLNPTSSPNAPLELSIPIPPPTQESRQQALATASKDGETASHAVRQARGVQQKKLRAMSVAKKVGPDDLKRASAKMEKVVEGGNAEVKKVVEAARRVLEQG